MERRREGRTNQNVLTSSLRLVLEVEPDEMLGESTISALVDLVENEVEEIESGDEGGREIWKADEHETRRGQRNAKRSDEK